MAQTTLTLDKVATLLRQRKAIQENLGTLTTRTASYALSIDEDAYELVLDGLRVQHHRVTKGEGYRWDATRQRFVACHCDFCKQP